MQAEPRAVVIARALVEGDVEVRPEPVQAIQVRVGEPITLRFAYHITEASILKDTWRMTLKTRHGEGERLASTEHTDRLLRKDVLWDALDETYAFDEEGSAVVHFDAEACMERTAWIGKGSPLALCHGVRGSVAIMVLP